MRYGNLAADSNGVDDGRPALVLLHGLTFDRRHWSPVLADLALAGSNRRVVAFDLPGHGESPRRDSYGLTELVDVLHEAITEADLTAPVVAGHSLGGVLATAYAARYPVNGVVNIDQPLRSGGFADFLRRSEPQLNSAGFLNVWKTLLDGMHIDELPPSAQHLVRTATDPRQDLFLGYWRDLMHTPNDQSDENTTRTLTAIHTARTPYHYIAGTPIAPTYRTWLETALPDVQITELLGSGHFPHLVHPAAVARALAELPVPTH
ncbi:alpha/beta fold hydrolase [Nocardia macrotermitis]|uniref:N-acyl homoserine lactonase n=1 Tax=Nocardia macrotermitis TaxID=2585198 RepID=A0A7K0DD32_9NOCA|nr:alpha/beta hydrolase [Nocardia macrotermitis]MQY22794.1 N-acyl homoserine lactonase [Nocardia macrotermitis]